MELAGANHAIGKLGGGRRMFNKLLQERRRNFQKWKKYQSERNKSCYIREKEAKKAVAREMRREAEKEVDDMKSNRKKIFKKLRIMKIDSCDIRGDNCLKTRVGKIVTRVDDRIKVWKEHMEAIMNEENQWGGVVVLVQAVMNLYKDAKTSVQVGNVYSEDFNVGVDGCPILSDFTQVRYKTIIS